VQGFSLIQLTFPREYHCEVVQTESQLRLIATRRPFTNVQCATKCPLGRFKVAFLVLQQTEAVVDVDGSVVAITVRGRRNDKHPAHEGYS
jgi:very-short-patch-repair endonuclease